MSYLPHTENRRAEVMAIVNTASPQEVDTYCQALGSDDDVQDERVDVLSNEIRQLPTRDIHRAVQVIEYLSKSAAPESQRVAAYSIGTLVVAMQSEERLMTQIPAFVDRWWHFILSPDDAIHELAAVELVNGVNVGLHDDHVKTILWALLNLLGEPWRRKPSGSCDTSPVDDHSNPG